MTPRGKWLFLLAVVIILFFWKILFTRQFSVFVDHDNANCVYAWNHFAASTIKQGVLPLWDPYVQAGRSFVAEMQTGLFYPLKAPLYLWPSNRSGLFSLHLLHVYYVIAHILGAFFMFFLAEELGLSPFPAVVASVCFSLAGFVGRVGWPYMLDSAIWLPLIVLFQIRALRATNRGGAVLCACVAGLALGMTILAGSIHVVMMDVLVVISAAIYFSVRSEQTPEGLPGGGLSWARGALVIGVIAAVALCAGAIQLFPSIEYSGLAVRHRDTGLAPLPVTQKPPYAELFDSFQPHSLLALLLGGISAGALAFSPYFGVLPFLLVVLGIGQNWEKPWVKYLTALGGLAFFYTLGRFSALHGLVYTLVPYLWMATQPGRFIYLTHFAMALLAGFGAQTLFFADGAAPDVFTGLVRVLKWTVIAAALALGIPALSAKPQADEWIYFSVLLLACSYGFFLYAVRPHQRRTAQFLLIALIFCDLNAFNWTIWNKMEEQKAGRNRLQELLDARSLANFIKSKGRFGRVHLEGDWAPNIGDLYGVQTTGGMSATVLKDFLWFWRVPRAPDLMNVRYFATQKTVEGATAIYQDSTWKVYENTTALPRAWVVHQVTTESSHENLEHRMGEPGFDPLRTAFVEAPLPTVELQPLPPGGREEIRFDLYRTNRLELTVRSPNRGLLVLSELYYPGWRATVNGQASAIHKVNGLLRGVVVPGGESVVIFRYAPRSVLAGAVLSALAFLGTLVFSAATRRKTHTAPAA